MTLGWGTGFLGARAFSDSGVLSQSGCAHCLPMGHVVTMATGDGLKVMWGQVILSLCPRGVFMDSLRIQSRSHTVYSN